tara:strand:+ start:462 stop:677 length:216 start_codon:yes stop_codon:yes gene_type:complete
VVEVQLLQVVIGIQLDQLQDQEVLVHQIQLQDRMLHTLVVEAEFTIHQEHLDQEELVEVELEHLDQVKVAE